MSFTIHTSIVLVLAAIVAVVAAKGKDGTCGCEPGVKTGKHYHSRKEACLNARDKCQSLFKNECKKGCVCPKSPYRCKLYSKLRPGFPKRENMPGVGKVWRCDVDCPSVTFDCSRPGAIQDPHFTDFSGVRFDFHGIGGNRYVMLARDGGDVLVAQMTEKKFVDPLTNVAEDRTFFETFGLQTWHGDQFKVSVGRQWWDGKERWTAIVNRNGDVLSTEVDDKDLSVQFNEDHRVVHITTKDIKYSFTAVPRKGQERLDFHVGLIRQISVNDRFMGVLGMSLNKKVGHDVRFGLMTSTDLHPTDLELSLRDAFEVTSLYPERSHVVSEMHGIVRMSDYKVGKAFHPGPAHGSN